MPLDKSEISGKLNDIIKDVKMGGSLFKAASSSLEKISSRSKSRLTATSQISQNLLKVAEDIKNSSGHISYGDIQSYMNPSQATYVSQSASPLLKAAQEIRSNGLHVSSEKVASVMNAAIGLKMLRDKIQK